ncbi:MAG: hypothetical protein H6811_11195 [Phycisphaeraceae bacterium]|nr:hypothetical protein [Phycisphaeraceae bacterium]
MREGFSLLYVGVDEAGYGPLLGPLCVGLCAFRTADAATTKPPDLWRSLKSAVTPAPNDKRRRIAIADSKRLKGANASRDPLRHLRRGVVGACGLLGDVPADELALLERLGVEFEPHPWYQQAAPVSWHEHVADYGFDSNALAVACERARIGLEALRCVAVCESRFNRVTSRTGTKASTTAGAIAQLLRETASRMDQDDALVVCDRLGGRSRYLGYLRRVFPAEQVDVLEETPAVSQYRVGRLVVRFQAEAEAAHLPVALASMVAKLVRELAMSRFNAYWSARDPSLKPTAGYWKDAKRWLADAAGALSPEERSTMVRLA